MSSISDNVGVTRVGSRSIEWGRLGPLAIWTAAVALMALVAFSPFFLPHGATATQTRTPADHQGPVETAYTPVPAYVQESIIYGDMDPGDISFDTEILPVYVVEGILEGE